MRTSTLRYFVVALIGAAIGLVAGYPSSTPVDGAPESSSADASWERYLSLPSVSGFSWSPRSSEIAYVANPDGQAAIYIVDPAQSRAPRRLANGSSPAWSPDGSTIAYSADGDLWTIPAAGGGAPTRVTTGPEEERQFEWSADGAQLVFMSARSGSQDVWTVGSRGGAPRQITTKSMDADEVRFGARWSPSGNDIAFVSNRAAWDHDDVWTVAPTGGEPRRLTTRIRARANPVWSPDGRSIAVNGFWHEHFTYGDMSDLFVVDVQSGRERRLEMPVTVAGAPVWSPDGRELLFSVVDHGDADLWRVALDDERHPTRVTYLEGSASAYDYSADGRWLAFVHSSPVKPASLMVMRIEGGEPRTLVDVSRDLPPAQRPRKIAYRSFDGKYINGFLYVPPGFDQPGAKFPALVEVHGGGTNLYRNGFNAIEQSFAQKGYIVLAINFRGSSGFGREFQDLSTLDWGGGQAHDAAMAAAYLRTLPEATGKVGIYGYSYGGMMAMAAAVRHPAAFDAVVAMAGIYDPVLAYAGRDRVGKLFTELGHGGSPTKNPDAYAKSASITRVANLRAPVLAMHGEADVRVPFNQLAALTKALRAHNKVFETHSYPGEPHGFRKLANRVDLYTRSQQWFERYLKGTS